MEKFIRFLLEKLELNSKKVYNYKENKLFR
jgi:hypothetical protein